MSNKGNAKKREERKELLTLHTAKHNCNSDESCFTRLCFWNITAVVESLQTHNKSMIAAVCAAELFTQRYCRWNSDTEIKLISVTLMWQQTIHDSIRSHFHSTTQRQRIPWSGAANGSLYQPLWKACLITHSSTTVPRVVGFPPTDTGSQSGAVRTAPPGSGVSTPAAYVIGNYRENTWEWNKGRPVYSGVLFLTLYLKERVSFMAMSSPSLHIISLCGSNQQPLISVFITRLIPWSLIVIQGEFSICAGAKYSHWTFYPFQPVQWIF